MMDDVLVRIARKDEYADQRYMATQAILDLVEDYVISTQRSQPSLPWDEVVARATDIIKGLG